MFIPIYKMKQNIEGWYIGNIKITNLNKKIKKYQIVSPIDFTKFQI